MSQSLPQSKNKIIRFFPQFGILGSALILGCSLITAIGYTGKANEPYSWLNHFISELGEVGVSELAIVFNLGLIFGGICYILFFIGLSTKFQTKLGKFSTILGVISSIFCSLVGVFPMNDIQSHTFVAMTFFYCGMIAMLLCSIAILFDKNSYLSKYLIIPAIIAVICFAAFLFMPPDMNGTGNSLDPNNFTRPDVWIFVMFEWLILYTVTAWIVSTSIYCWKKQNH